MTRRVLSAAAFTIIAPGTLTVGVPAATIWFTGDEMAENAVAAIGLIVIAIGIAGWLWCVFDFVARGRGKPNPYDAPTELVVRGLYRLVRNPMYVTLIIVLIGEALLFTSPWIAAWAAVLFVGFHVRVITYEEPTLARTFGASWERYRADTRRWIPRLS